MLNVKPSNFGHFLASATTFISLMATIVYITWFAASIDKRVSLLEQHDVNSQRDFQEMKDQLDSANQGQDQLLHEFQVSFDNKLVRLDDKIERIMFLLSSKK
jgi:hypothetical protein